MPFFVTVLKRATRRSSTSALLRSQTWPEIKEGEEVGGRVAESLETAVEMRVGLEEAIETVAPWERDSWATEKPIPEEPPIMRIEWPLIDGILFRGWLGVEEF